MEQQYIDYMTKEGDRWDSIAYAQYGDVEKMNLLIMSNPHVAADPVLAGGMRLLIPIIEKNDASTDAQKLPYWKR